VQKINLNALVLGVGAATQLTAKDRLYGLGQQGAFCNDLPIARAITASGGVRTESNRDDRKSAGNAKKCHQAD
jgi:hypothetical protein